MSTLQKHSIALLGICAKSGNRFNCYRFPVRKKVSPEGKAQACQKKS
eukprot:CAMPEP_0115507030 /NCGR_PEP_ID=MMETSP0271-20121206/71499_1 /TAXON_ID=71861 /ORGANISM="Scrippsiella trochoidea, Strain CCMP3099" /LENGTH=46 /DNA_ID= /DNA_START= /DNA_END= /DNA_ORIENTATION=